MSAKPTIGILGGGALGLAAAYKLTKEGYRVEILERLEYKGGLAGSLKIGDAPIERFYHHFFLSDTTLKYFVDELELQDKMLWLESSMGFYTNGKIYPFSTPMQLLFKFTAISFIDRLRFGLSSVILGKLSEKEYLHHTPAVDWIKKYAGNAVLETIWKPLMIHKFGKYYDKVPIAWLWKRFSVRASSRQGSVEKLGYIKGSLGVFIEALSEKIEQQGGKIFTGCNIQKIRKQGDKIEVITEDKTYAYDKVIATFAPKVFNHLTEGLSEEIISKNNNLEYTGVVCPILILKKQFSKYYWINIGDTAMPFNGLIEQTNFLPKELYNNKHILYISNYCFTDHPNYSMNNDELLKVYVAALQKLNPEFDESWIEEVIWSRAAFAQPVVTLNHPDKLPPKETNIKGLYNINMAHIYPEDRGVNYSLKLGLEIADLIINAN
jgi:protoporphyrinogen oxidase